MSATARLKFAKNTEFFKDLRRRVNAYFEENNLDPRNQPDMVAKTLTIYAWWITCYALLVFGGLPIWAFIPVVIAMGLAGAGIGFSVMHDAGHRAYVSNNKLNRAIFYSLDFLGGSSYLWHFKHNQLHHSYANIEGHDDDIDMGALGRLAPEQKHLFFHRFQHFYVWLLYSFLSIKWVLFDDFAVVAKGRIGKTRIPRPRGRDLVGFIVGKLVFATVMFVIPTLVHSFAFAVVLYLTYGAIQGFTLAIVFQLAHCVEEAEFPLPDENGQLATDWAEHQLRTTVDFGKDNKLLCWYVGGLNFQVEHHLFPKICHVHYPAIAPIVEQACAEYEIPYKAVPTFRAGLASHYRQLRTLGRSPQTLATPVTA